MKVTIKNITPELAAKYLQKNKSNRKINRMHLSMLVRTINEGLWRLNHQGVAFYDDGSLADGQHRLTAIIETGATLKMPVFTGIEKEKNTILSIDSGRGRTVTDSSAIAGFEITAKDKGLVLGLFYGYKDKFKKLTHSELYDLCNRFKKEIEICKDLFPKSIPHISILPVKVACVEAVLSGVPSLVVKEFVKTLCSGEYDAKIFRNAVKLRNKLLSKNFNGGNDRLYIHDLTLNTLKRTGDNKVIEKLTH